MGTSSHVMSTCTYLVGYRILSNRKQRVSVHGLYSNWTNVISGVPQGSVLGLTLLIIYGNNLPDSIQSFLRLLLMTPKCIILFHHLSISIYCSRI